ncbi:MAG: creatininase family protein [Phycisphaerae bacterium]
MFADKSWLELKEYIERESLVLLPLGTVEEHGPHMAVGADAMIAEDTARDIAQAFSREKDVPPILVMPTFWSGYSMEIMRAWPGTISVRPEIVLAALTDIIGSLAKMGFFRIVVSNNHGHHDGICRQLVRDVADKFNVWIAVLEPAALGVNEFSAIRKSAPGGAIHGCEYETSLLMHYGRPVDMSKATNEDLMRYSSKFVPGDGFAGSKKVIWSTWGLQASKTGVYGDPSVARKETGEKMAKAIIANSVEFLKEFCRQTVKK